MSMNKAFVRLGNIYIERDCYEGKSFWVWFQFPVLLIYFVLKPAWLGNLCVIPGSGNRIVGFYLILQVVEC